MEQGRDSGSHIGCNRLDRCRGCRCRQSPACRPDHHDGGVDHHDNHEHEHDREHDHDHNGASQPPGGTDEGREAERDRQSRCVLRQSQNGVEIATATPGQTRVVSPMTPGGDE